MGVIEFAVILAWSALTMKGDFQMDMRTEVMGHVVVATVVVAVAGVDAEHVEAIGSGVVAAAQNRTVAPGQWVQKVAVHSVDEADHDRR